MRTYTRIFLGVWFSGATFIALFSVVYSGLSLMTGDKTPGENHVLGLILPPIFMGLACCALWFSKRASSSDRESILEFLHTTLRASPTAAITT
jgi:hypothetical protein